MQRSGAVLALRLRALRVSTWPGVALHQGALAAALGLSTASISAYENTRRTSVPPEDRLADYATFFATRRSIDGGTPRLLDLGDLTDEERARRADLHAELQALRDAASDRRGGAPAAGPAEDGGPGIWHFPDGGEIALICAELPKDERTQYADPADPSYAELFSYADLDAMVELFGHVRARNPGSEVRYRLASGLRSDDMTNHLVLIGGPAWNPVTLSLAARLDLPVQQVLGPSGAEDVFRTREAEPREFGAVMAEGAQGPELVEDVGLLVRVPNPNNADRTVTFCSGVWSRGVLGAVRSLTDVRNRAANHAYLDARFADDPGFCVLMRVGVTRGRVGTPDFRVPGTMLYEWP